MLFRTRKTFVIFTTQDIFDEIRELSDTFKAQEDSQDIVQM